jgi:hypothetical protein
MREMYYSTKNVSYESAFQPERIPKTSLPIGLFRIVQDMPSVLVWRQIKHTIIVLYTIEIT